MTENTSLAIMTPNGASQFDAMMLPRKLVALLKMSKNRDFCIPAVLQNVQMSGAERSMLRNLAVRSSWSFNASRKKALVKADKAAFYSLMMASAITGGACIYGSLPLFLGLCVPAMAFGVGFLVFVEILKKRVDIWVPSFNHKDWDAVMRDNLVLLKKKGVEMPEILDVLRKRLEDKEWMDDIVYARLGAVDTLAMMRLSSTLSGISSDVKNIVLDGDTQELVSRVLETVQEYKSTRREAKISAMSGLENLA